MAVKKTPTKGKATKTIPSKGKQTTMTPARKTNTPLHTHGRYREVFGMLLLCISVLGFYAIFTSSDQFLISGIKDAALGLAGALSAATPLVIAYVGVLFIFSGKGKLKVGKIILISLLGAFVFGFWHLFSANAIMERIQFNSAINFIQASFNEGADTSQSAGALGAIFSYHLYSALGVWGAGIVFIFSTVIDLVILSKVSVKDISEKFSDNIHTGIVTVREKAKVLGEERAQRRAEMLEERDRLEALKDEEEEILRAEREEQQRIDFEKRKETLAAKANNRKIEIWEDEAWRAEALPESIKTDKRFNEPEVHVKEAPLPTKNTHKQPINNDKFGHSERIESSHEEHIEKAQRQPYYYEQYNVELAKSEVRGDAESRAKDAKRVTQIPEFLDKSANRKAKRIVPNARQEQPSDIIDGHSIPVIINNTQADSPTKTNDNSDMNEDSCVELVPADDEFVIDDLGDDDIWDETGLEPENLYIQPDADDTKLEGDDVEDGEIVYDETRIIDDLGDEIPPFDDIDDEISNPATTSNKNEFEPLYEDDDGDVPKQDRLYKSMVSRIVDSAKQPDASIANKASLPQNANAPSKSQRIDYQPVKMPPKAQAKQEEEIFSYNYPPLDLLSLPKEQKQSADKDRIDAEKSKILEDTLKSFAIPAKVIGISHGPAVTRFEMQLAPGIKVSRITGLADNIALSLASTSVRIEAPIPGKAAVGVEVPNDSIEIVTLREVLESNDARKNPSRLAVALGRDNAGKHIVVDLAKMPHTLIAGATGSGKSVCINSIIISILYRATPEEVRLILIDPKVVELSVYNGIPHLLVPVVTDPKKAAGALAWAVSEMEVRYRKFAERGVRDMKGFNMSIKEGEKPLPQIVVIIDELADLMMVAPGEIEDAICRLAQLARAAGIHLVIATQRPSVNVITGIIKANIPSRIAFTVSSQVDSRTIIDMGGAERLLGKGDMLYYPQGLQKPQRVQGAWVSDDEVHAVTTYVRSLHDTDYDPDVVEKLDREGMSDMEKEDADDEYDELLPQAIDFVMESGQASISMLQRKMRIGYARAGRLIEAMVERGIVGKADGAKPRTLLVTREDIRYMFKD